MPLAAQTVETRPDDQEPTEQSISIADGADVAQGSTLDAEATGDGTIIALLKRLRTLLGALTKSNNAAVPGANNLGTFPAVATENPPAYTEGRQVALSVDLEGRLRSTESAGGAGGNVGAGPLTDLSGTITTGGLSQQVTAANTDRKHFVFQNLHATAVMWLRFGSAAVAGQPSFRVEPGGSYETNTFCSTQSVNVICATGAAEFSAYEATDTDGPVSGLLTNQSGTITTGGVSQQVMAANAARQHLVFQNVSDTDMWIRPGGAAANAGQPSILVVPGASYETATYMSTQALSVICETMGKEFTSYEA